jgi:hypothetical protein
MRKGTQSPSVRKDSGLGAESWPGTPCKGEPLPPLGFLVLMDGMCTLLSGMPTSHHQQFCTLQWDPRAILIQGHL